MTRRGHGHVYVYIWFDIEDYVTLESDDLPLVALAILNKYDVKATCKMVAEKVRELLEHGRTDVISAISHHDVGYHTDTHSKHPTAYEYMANLDILEGSQKFASVEKNGLKLVENVFQRKMSCFGHAGPAWTAHYYPALEKMGIPVYLDETKILNLNDRPYWYCGVLNLNGANRNFIRFDYTYEDPSGLVRLKKEFKTIHDRVQKKGWGTISLLFHLHTAINREYWDAVNFANGRNTPKESYVRPKPQSKEVTQRAWNDFEELVKYMKSFHDVQFIAATDASKIFGSKKEIVLDRSLIKRIPEKLGTRIKYLKAGNDSFLSPAEIFYFVTKCLDEYSRTGKRPTKVRILPEPLGPESLMRSRIKGRKIKTAELFEAAGGVLVYFDTKNRIPSFIKLDGGDLSPEDFLATGSKILKLIIKGSKLPDKISVVGGRFVNSKFVDQLEFRKACRWIILPRGFKAPNIFRQIVLQTWTLKPALPQVAATREKSRLGS